MSDKPIPLYQHEVRAIRDLRQTMLRRVLKPQPRARGAKWHADFEGGSFLSLHCPTREKITLPYQPGDRLYAKEAWKKVPRTAYWHDSTIPHQENGEYWAVYREGWERSAPHPWMPSTNMPRWASRLTLLVTAVKVERLMEISEEDARAEGVLYVPGEGEITPEMLRADPGWSNYLCCRNGFELLWNSINAKREGCRREDNPWVVAVTFEPVMANIDSLEKAA